MGKNIRLRTIDMNDLPFIFKWSKDEVFCLLNEWEVNRKQEEMYGWWERCCKIQRSPNFQRLGIEYEGRLIGYADIAKIQNESAEVGIAIGESALWGKGLGTKVLTLLMDYGKEELGLKLFQAETNEVNDRSRRMLEKAGFHQIDMKGNNCFYKMEA